MNFKVYKLSLTRTVSFHLFICTWGEPGIRVMYWWNTGCYILSPGSTFLCPTVRVSTARGTWSYCGFQEFL